MALKVWIYYNNYCFQSDIVSCHWSGDLVQCWYWLVSQIMAPRNTGGGGFRTGGCGLKSLFPKVFNPLPPRTQKAHDGMVSAMVCSKEYLYTSSFGCIKVLSTCHYCVQNYWGNILMNFKSILTFCTGVECSNVEGDPQHQWSLSILGAGTRVWQEKGGTFWIWRK